MKSPFSTHQPKCFGEKGSVVLKARQLEELELLFNATVTTNFSSGIYLLPLLLMRTAVPTNGYSIMLP
jgi:hypothetical protein